MTPAARINAAIDLVDGILGGDLADRALNLWGRKNRYAGSKDRAAIADIVYDVLRQKRSCAAMGGGQDGRALLIGYLRANGQEPGDVFGTGTYAPPALTDAEAVAHAAPDPDSSAGADMPDWLWPDLCASLGTDAVEIAQAMRGRAPVHLRVNLAKTNRNDAVATLAAQGIIGHAQALSPTAIEVTDGARKIKHAQAYLDGLVELQDAASQAVADMVPLRPGARMLDFCAGGGGKTLAVAGRVAGVFAAHDVQPGRMKDIPARAARAGVAVDLLDLSQVKNAVPYDTVVIDAPCSGSGSWRRDPQGKWLLTRDKLDETITLQRDILAQCVPFVGDAGHLVYATCSLLAGENADQTAGFLATHPDFHLREERQFTPLDGGDGFYCAVLQRGS